MAVPTRPAVIQNHGAMVGNFINCTPAAQAIAQVIGEPLDVYFDDPPCAELVRDATFLRRVESPPDPRRIVVRSIDFGLNKKIPDWLSIYRSSAVKLYGHKGHCPHTYVDRVRDLPLAIPVGGNGFAVVVRGAASVRWHERKDPGDAIYRHIIARLIERGMTVVLIGGPNDKRWWATRMKSWHKDILDATGPGLRKALALLSAAALVIANDTGLYHAAAALRKRTFVLWKKTKLAKNRAPGDSYKISVGPTRWKRDFERWLLTT